MRLVYTVSSAAELPAPQSVGTAFDINWFAAVNYQPRVYPGRLNLFCSTEEGVKWDPELGWGGLASNGLEIHELPGNHLEMFQGSHVKLLAQLVEGCIDAALDQESAGISSPNTMELRTSPTMRDPR